MSHLGQFCRKICIRTIGRFGTARRPKTPDWVYFPVILSFLLLAVLAWAFSAPGAVSVQAQAGDPPPPMPPLPQGLEPPPTVYPPTEISKGSNVYYLVCMACHGDRGQGLTDDWRGMLDPADQNCWQSKCHHSNHPPGGFVFPKYVPPVTGRLMTARFATGLELHEYIRTEMPFQAPGSLSEEEYWQLTAFLLSLNGANPGDRPLTSETAARIALGGPGLPAAAAPPAAAPPAAGGAVTRGMLIGGVLMGLVVFALALIALKPSKDPSDE